MTFLYRVFCAAAVGSTLFADYRGWTLGSVMPWSSVRRFENSLNHK